MYSSPLRDRNVTSAGRVSITLRYLYDENRSPVGFGLRNPGDAGWTNFYFAKNLQGDVTAVYRSDASSGSYYGTLVAAYTYDPYGQVLTMVNGEGADVSGNANSYARINPFRYRGYYQDNESGFYYLQSRYYDPEICRFINADSCITTGQGFLGNNMFAYCLNNPVKYTDNGGEFGALAAAFTLLTIVAVAVLVDVIVQCVSNIVHGLGEIINNCIEAAQPVYIDSAIDNPNKSNLPDYGPTSEIPDAPAVDAWQQGKHVPGHPNNREGKTQWEEGETGVQQTQEAWKNGQVVRDPSKGEIRVGESSDGRTVRVHKGRHGWIHGYPLENIPELY